MDLYDDGSTLIRPTKRQERRSAFRLPVEIDVRVEGAAHRFEALTGDLSTGGMFVAVSRWVGDPIPVGTHVMLNFTLREGGDLNVIGVVQWRRDDHHDGVPGLGIAFFCLEPEARATITRFCAVREPFYSLSDEAADIAQSA